MSYFVRAKNRIKDINLQKHLLSAPLSFGNKFLDLATGGILKDDLIIITARTGGGKTEIVTQIAQSNVKEKKKVHFFALEAFEGEIEQRIKFKLLAQAFFNQQNWREFKAIPNFQDWAFNKLKQIEILEKFEQEVDKHIEQSFDTLFTYYRDNNFDIDEFESKLTQIEKETDLIIIDHLHYFDFEDVDENKALKKTVKQIKDLVSFYRKPVILVVQLRKQNKSLSELLPDIEEIHGSSDIAKIATRIIATAPAKDQEKTRQNILPTYIKLLKNRYDGSRCFYTSLCGFDIQKNSYTDAFKLGELRKNNSEFIILDEMDYPQWAR